MGLPNVQLSIIFVYYTALLNAVECSRPAYLTAVKESVSFCLWFTSSVSLCSPLTYQPQRIRLLSDVNDFGRLFLCRSTLLLVIVKVHSHQTRIPYKVNVETRIGRFDLSRHTFALHRRARSRGFVVWQIRSSWKIIVYYTGLLNAVEHTWALHNLGA